MRCPVCLSPLEPHDEICRECGALTMLGYIRAGGYRATRLPRRFLMAFPGQPLPPTATKSITRFVAGAIMLLALVGGFAIGFRTSDPHNTGILAQLPRAVSG